MRKNVPLCTDTVHMYQEVLADSKVCPKCSTVSSVDGQQKKSNRKMYILWEDRELSPGVTVVQFVLNKLLKRKFLGSMADDVVAFSYLANA